MTGAAILPYVGLALDHYDTCRSPPRGYTVVYWGCACCPQGPGMFFTLSVWEGCSLNSAQQSGKGMFLTVSVWEGCCFQAQQGQGGVF